MSVFNSNLRFMCKKMGLGQQALADALELKRGKVAGYFYETQAKPDFHQKLGKKFDLNVGKFLTVEMNDSNYDSFFEVSGVDNGTIPVKQEFRKSDIIDLLLTLKSEQDPNVRNQIIDSVIKMYGNILDEISNLKDENSRLKDDLLNELRKRT